VAATTKSDSPRLFVLRRFGRQALYRLAIQRTGRGQTLIHLIRGQCRSREKPVFSVHGPRIITFGLQKLLGLSYWGICAKRIRHAECQDAVKKHANYPNHASFPRKGPAGGLQVHRRKPLSGHGYSLSILGAWPNIRSCWRSVSARRFERIRAC